MEAQIKSIIKVVAGKSIFRINCALPDGAAGIEYSPQEKAVVFYCPDDGTIGFVGDDGTLRPAARRLEVNAPVGMCCDKWGIVILQTSREMLWLFDQSCKSGVRMCGGGLFESFARMFVKSPSAPYGICRTGRLSLAVAMPGSNQIAWVCDGQASEVWGTGRKGFLSSTSTKATAFNAPSGVCFDEGSGLFFVSDTGNSVVRVFRGRVEVSFVGVPGQSGCMDGPGTSARLKVPAAIRSSRGMIAFVDGNLVRTFMAASLDVATPYASSNEVLDIAVGGDAIYVLEAKCR